MSIFRNAVSKDKRRYQKNGFDLDLSYVTNKIIAMGFPSENVEAAYRNPMKEVQRFLDSFHKDHYKVYNLCSERTYDAQKFYNRVGHYPFDDHNAPPFELILQFCRNVQEWLTEHDDNIAVIHCKAGKGRTGLMICAWLLYSGVWKTPIEALNFYAAMRTYNMKGVTIPSQIRYVYYFHESIASGKPELEHKLLLLNRVILHTLPKSGHVADVNFTVHVGKTQVFMYKDYAEKMKIKEPKVVKLDGKKKKDKNKGKDVTHITSVEADKKGKEDDIAETDANNNNHANGREEEGDGAQASEETATFECGMIPVCGDVKLDFERQGGRIFMFWFNTAFVKDGVHLTITKEGLDKAWKDKHHKLYDECFRVELAFTEMTQQPTRAKLNGSSSSPSILTNGVSASTSTSTNANANANANANGRENGVNVNENDSPSTIIASSVVMDVSAEPRSNNTNSDSTTPVSVDHAN